MAASHLSTTTITRHAVGTPPRVGVTLLGAILALAALPLGMALLGTEAAWAHDTGTLKLMVTDCSGTPYDGTSVEVKILHAGSGVVAADDGVTEDGYVEFTFTILEDEDQAHVTVEACGNEIATHVYVWVSENGNTPGFWDIGDRPNAACTDKWWDEQENIIQLRCD